jgi:hypothetical protein
VGEILVLYDVRPLELLLLRKKGVDNANGFIEGEGHRTEQVRHGFAFYRRPRCRGFGKRCPEIRAVAEMAGS